MVCIAIGHAYNASHTQARRQATRVYCVVMSSCMLTCSRHGTSYRPATHGDGQEQSRSTQWSHGHDTGTYVPAQPCDLCDAVLGVPCDPVAVARVIAGQAEAVAERANTVADRANATAADIRLISSQKREKKRSKFESIGLAVCCGRSAVHEACAQGSRRTCPSTRRRWRTFWPRRC